MNGVMFICACGLGGIEVYRMIEKILVK